MPKIRVLVVDDAVVMRRLISEALSRDPEIEVVGLAAHGKIALAKIPQVNPDVITLDVEMPELDGIETVREIRKTYQRLPVIMFSTLTERGAVRTLEALAAGATDYVTKPANVGSVTASLQRLQEELIPKIKLHGRGIRSTPASVVANTGTLGAPQLNSRPSEKSVAAPVAPELFCIGCSTGGPNALAEIFANLPAAPAVPIVIVQHMPVLFTKMLAERLDKLGPVRFSEGVDGQALAPGHAYIAPGGRHMEVQRIGGSLRIRLHDQPPENSCRPAVDVLFRSVAAASGKNVLALILTGMGQDGLHGCHSLHELHAQILAQDEASSVVWGMPGHVAQAGLAHRILPLKEIAQEISRRLRPLPSRPTPMLSVSSS
ncbi:MAG TPA: chemotaxis response regulator protein-glutamate methylesterase [Opitutaceae bacterium]|nr:chemotaxis response regulator protein-glutamate methylesterase [Opitutaceae bacterium]